MEKTLVWAKMRGFPPWPGKICKPRLDMTKPKQPSKWIFFFGNRIYYWIEDSNLKPYLKHRDSIVKTIKNNPLKEAVKMIDEYISDPEKFKANGPDEEDNELYKGNDSRAKSRDSLNFGFVKQEPEENYIHMTKRARRTEEEDPKITFVSTSDHQSTYIPFRQQHNPGEMLPDPIVIEKPSQSINMSQTQHLQNIVAFSKTFGFLGVGIMGSGIVKNLLNSGHKVIIWNRDPLKSRKLKEIGAQVVMTPCEVIQQVDIIFYCRSDFLATKESIFGEIFPSNQHFGGKGFIEMTDSDSEMSQELAGVIVSNGGRYLEAKLIGSDVQAEDASLYILAAGDRTIFDECQSGFMAIGKNPLFFGDHQQCYSIMQSMKASITLANSAGLQRKDIMKLFELTMAQYHT